MFPEHRVPGTVVRAEREHVPVPLLFRRVSSSPGAVPRRSRSPPFPFRNKWLRRNRRIPPTELPPATSVRRSRSAIRRSAVPLFPFPPFRRSAVPPFRHRSSMPPFRRRSSMRRSAVPPPPFPFRHSPFRRSTPFRPRRSRSAICRSAVPHRSVVHRSAVPPNGFSPKRLQPGMGSAQNRFSPEWVQPEMVCEYFCTLCGAQKGFSPEWC